MPIIKIEVQSGNFNLLCANNFNCKEPEKQLIGGRNGVFDHCIKSACCHLMLTPVSRGKIIYQVLEKVGMRGYAPILRNKKKKHKRARK